MLEQNYTNVEDKGRLGFSESGKFRAPYKYEKAFILTLLKPLTGLKKGTGIAAKFLLGKGLI